MEPGLGARRVELVAQCLTLATATLLTLAPGHLTLGFAPLPGARVGGRPVQPVGRRRRADRSSPSPISLLTQLGGGPFSDIVEHARPEQHPLRPALPHLRRADRPAAGHRDGAARARSGAAASRASGCSGATSPSRGSRSRSSTCEQGEARFGDCNRPRPSLLRRPVGRAGRPTRRRLARVRRPPRRPRGAERRRGRLRVDRPRRRGRPAAHAAGGDPVVARARRGAGVVLPPHGRRHRAPRAPGATAGRARLHPVGDRHGQQHDRGDRRRRHRDRGQPGHDRADRLHRGRAGRPALLGEAARRGPARGGRRAVRRSRAAAPHRRGAAAAPRTTGCVWSCSPPTSTRPTRTHRSPT